MNSILLAIAFSLCAGLVLAQPEPPNENFTITPSEIVQRIGARAEINCELRGSPTAVINWGVGKLASFQFILPDNRTSIKVSGDGGRALIFDPVSQGQEGNYYCWVALSETESVYSKVVPLTILREPVVTNKDKPSGMVEFTYNLTVRTPATLNFITSGRPTPSLTLYKKDKNTMEYVEVFSERFTVQLIGIKISSVEPEDDGDYKLVANYTESYNDTEEFTIFVHIPPVAPRLMLEVLDSTATDDTRVFAHVRSRVAVSCRMTEAYTSNLRISWVFNMQATEFSVNPSLIEANLIIDDVNKDNAGIYSCRAINDVDETLISVNLVVGYVPEPFTVTATSTNYTLTVDWEDNTIRPSEERVLAYYAQYKPVNGSNAVVVVEKLAASIRRTMFREGEHGVEYLVSMWSENSFGNSSASNEVSVVINGPTTGPTSQTPSPSAGTNVGAGSSSSSSSDTAIIGTVIGVCVLVLLVFCTVVILLVILFLNNRRIQAQQQWQKDPEFQSQLSLSAGSMRVPHIPSSESMPPPVPIYAMPFLNNGFSSSSISKRSSEDNSWQIPRDNIQLSELLAEGEHTVLYRATVFSFGKFKKTTEVTVKQVKDNNSSPEEVKVLIEEMDLMRDLGIHPNVVNVLAVCTVGDPVYLLMDYFAHGDLLGFLRATRGHTEHYTVSAGTETKVPQCSVQPQDLLSLASQVANGMTFLEERKVAHRSLCARNVLVGTGLQVKIYNYGQKNDDQSSYAKWMAPETLFDGTANTTSDVWSFGVTLWEIVTIGGSPYFQMRPEDMRKVLEDGYRMPNPDHCSEEIYKIMQDCWEYDPQDRPSFDLISYRLETLSKSKLSYIDLKLYDEVLYSQFEDTPQLCTAL